MALGFFLWLLKFRDFRVLECGSNSLYFSLAPGAPLAVPLCTHPIFGAQGNTLRTSWVAGAWRPQFPGAARLAQFLAAPSHAVLPLRCASILRNQAVELRNGLRELIVFAEHQRLGIGDLMVITVRSPLQCQIVVSMLSPSAVALHVPLAPMPWSDGP